MAAHLRAECKNARHEDREHPRRQVDQLLLLRKNGGERRREKHHQKAHRRRNRNRDGNQHPEGLAHPAFKTRAVVIADDRLDPLSKAVDRHDDQLHHALHDGHRPDIKIPAVFLQAGIEDDVDQAFGALHQKRRNAERCNASHNFPVQLHVLTPQPDHALFAEQKPHHPNRAERLGKDRRKRRAAHAKPGPEDQDRVEDDVRDCADQDGQHRGLRVSLRADIGVEPQRDLHKDGPD